MRIPIKCETEMFREANSIYGHVYLNKQSLGHVSLPWNRHYWGTGHAFEALGVHSHLVRGSTYVPHVSTMRRTRSDWRLIYARTR